MTQLPPGWEQAKLDTLLEFVIGGDWGNDPDYDDEDFVPVYCIRGSEFRHWSIGKGKSASLRKVKNSSLEKRKLKEGDLLIEISGGGPDQPVGRSVLIDESVLKHNEEYHKICTNFIRLARPYDNISSKYLNYYLHGFYLSGEVVKYQGGSNNLRNLKFKEYISIGIPLPPLPEQIRIANKLDSLLAKVETAQTRLEKIPALLKRFRQAVLTAATSGELTREWREENKFSSDEKWSQTSFGLHVNLINGDRGKKYPNRDEYVDIGIPFINTGHIELNGSLSLERMNYISREKFNSLNGGKVKNGDLVYCLRGATMGKTAIIDQFDEGAIASSLVIIRPRDNIFTKYAYFFLTSPIGKRLVKEFDNGSAQPNLSAKSLSLYPIALPPLVEQREIVRRVESLFTMADTVDKQYQAAKARLDKLTQAILAKAFRGELVAQDPNDEPAAELLKRIQAGK